MPPILKPRSEALVSPEGLGRLAGLAAAALDEAEDVGNGLMAVQMAGPAGEKTLRFPSPVVPVVAEILARLSSGQIVTVIPELAELTIPEAADILNVSKPFVAGLLDRREIPSTGEGAFRRVVYRDLLTYKARSDAEGKAALDALAEMSQEMGLY